MEEESDWSIGKLFADHRWQEHQVIIVHPDWKTREYYSGWESSVRTDVSFAVVGDDNIRKSLVYRLILGPRRGLVEGFRLWSIGNRVVESGPQDLNSAVSLHKRMM